MESFVPNAWKRGTYTTLVLRAHAICSTKELSDQQTTNHLQQIFVTFNGYPNCVVLQILNKFEIDLSTTSSTKNQQPDTRMFLLLYVGMQGEHALKHIKREINKFLTEVKNMQLVNTGTKLGTKFSLKDKTKNHHHLT